MLDIAIPREHLLRRCNEMQTCSLCGKMALMTNNHLFPRWFLKMLMGPGELNTNNNYMWIMGAEHRPYNQSTYRGFFDYSVCARCNNEHFARIENEFKNTYTKIIRSTDEQASGIFIHSKEFYDFCMLSAWRIVNYQQISSGLPKIEHQKFYQNLKDSIYPTFRESKIITITVIPDGSYFESHEKCYHIFKIDRLVAKQIMDRYMEFFSYFVDLFYNISANPAFNSNLDLLTQQLREEIDIFVQKTQYIDVSRVLNRVIPIEFVVFSMGPISILVTIDDTSHWRENIILRRHTVYGRSKMGFIPAIPLEFILYKIQMGMAIVQSQLRDDVHRNKDLYETLNSLANMWSHKLVPYVIPLAAYSE